VKIYFFPRSEADQRFFILQKVAKNCEIAIIFQNCEKIAWVRNFSQSCEFAMRIWSFVLVEILTKPLSEQWPARRHSTRSLPRSTTQLLRAELLLSSCADKLKTGDLLESEKMHQLDTTSLILLQLFSPATYQGWVWNKQISCRLNGEFTSKRFLKGLLKQHV